MICIAARRKLCGRTGHSADSGLIIMPSHAPLQVQLQLVTATVKLFLKKPTEKPQAMIQLVLTYATQETDNPDLRDRACALDLTQPDCSCQSN